MIQQNRQYPGATWESIASPEDAGWSAQQLDTARACAEVLGSAAVMVITGGKILVEWGDTARRLPCHSMRKSLLSSLFGLALQEGRLHTSQTLEELGIDDNEPALTAQEKQATLGTGGHFVLVIPALDTVIVHRMESETNRQVWSLSRDYFGRFLKVLLAAKDIP
jgi:hypothetical protein